MLNLGNLVHNTKNRVIKTARDYGRYFAHLFILIVPYRLPPFGKYYGTNVPGNIQSWNQGSLESFIEEARLQYDRQRAESARIESLSQFLFVTGVGVLAIVIGFYGDISGGWTVLWWIAFSLHILGVWGTGSVLRNKKVYGTKDIIIMSKNRNQFRTKDLAEFYIKVIPPGENTNATILGHYWIAARLMVYAGVIFAIVWIAGREKTTSTGDDDKQAFLSLIGIA